MLFIAEKLWELQTPLFLTMIGLAIATFVGGKLIMPYMVDKRLKKHHEKKSPFFDIKEQVHTPIYSGLEAALHAQYNKFLQEEKSTGEALFSSLDTLSKEEIEPQAKRLKQLSFLRTNNFHHLVNLTLFQQEQTEHQQKLSHLLRTMPELHNIPEYTQAQTALDAGDANPMIDFLTDHKDFASKASIYAALGHGHALQLSPIKAAEYFVEAQQSNPQSVPHLHQAISALVHIGEHQQVWDYIQQAEGAGIRFSKKQEIDILIGKSNFLSDKQQLKEAIDYRQQAIALLLEEHEPDPFALMAHYDSLSLLFYAFGENAQALEIQKKSLEIKEKYLTHDHLSFGFSYYILSKIENNDEKQHITDLLTKAYNIYIRHLRDDHPEIAEIYTCISKVFLSESQADQSLTWIQKSTEIHEKTLGKYSIDGTYNYDILARLYLMQKDYDKAKEYISHNILTKETIVGKSSILNAPSYEILSCWYQEQNMPEKAIETGMHALAIVKESSGEKCSFLSGYYQSLGKIHQEQGNINKALDLYNRATALNIHNYGEDSLNTITSHIYTIMAYMAKGQYLKAMRLSNKTLATAKAFPSSYIAQMAAICQSYSIWHMIRTLAVGIIIILLILCAIGYFYTPEFDPSWLDDLEKAP